MSPVQLLKRVAIVIAFVLGAGIPLHAEGPVLLQRADGLMDVASPPPGGVVRYTLDGSEPVRDSGVWLAPVHVPAGYVLKARTFSPDGTPTGGLAVHAAPLLAGASRPASTLVPVTQNRDWRTYDWVERHAAAVALMQERRPEIVMLGDSITHFWGGDPVGGPRHGAAEWDHVFAGRRVVNLGYGWDRTENVLWRLTHGEFENVTPEVVVVMIGTNNVGINRPEEIVAGIAEICRVIHERSPATRILLLGVFPRGERPDAARDTVLEVNRRIASFGGRDGITYLDIGSRFVAADGSISRAVMYDFLHPTAQGYAIWSQAMAPTLERLLAERPVSGRN